MTLMDQVIVSEHLGRVPEEHVESWMVVTLKDCYDHPFLRPWPAVSIKQRMMAVYDPNGPNVTSVISSH